MSSADLSAGFGGAAAGMVAFGPVGAFAGGLLGALSSKGARRRERRKIQKILAERAARKAAKIKYALQASRDTNLDNKAALEANLKAYTAIGAGAMTGGPGGMLRALYSQNAALNRDSRRMLARDLSAAEDIGIYEGFDPSGGAAAEGRNMANLFKSATNLRKGYDKWKSGKGQWGQNYPYGPGEMYSPGIGTSWPTRPSQGSPFGPYAGGYNKQPVFDLN